MYDGRRLMARSIGELCVSVSEWAATKYPDPEQEIGFVSGDEAGCQVAQVGTGRLPLPASAMKMFAVAKLVAWRSGPSQDTRRAAGVPKTMYDEIGRFESGKI